jgi:hypothetical protein
VSFFKATRLNPAIFVLCVAAISVNSQTHFTFTSKTGNNMTVDIDTAIHPTVNGLPMANGDEIGVFSIDSADTPSVLCVGAIIWRDVNSAITVWGDNDQTPVKDGMHGGDTLIYRVWDSSLSQEIPAAVTYASGGPTYITNAFPVLASLIAPPFPEKPHLVSPANTAIINTDSAVFVWHKGSPLIDGYSREIATDSLMTTILSVDSSSLTDTTDVYKGIVNGMSYWWRVMAHNGSGWGVYSDTFKFTVTSTAVVLPKSYSLNLYTLSKTRSLINYSLPLPSQVSIKLYSMQGKCIKTLCNAFQSSGSYQITFDCAEFSKGFYVLVFNAGNQVIRKKLLNF